MQWLAGLASRSAHSHLSLDDIGERIRVWFFLSCLDRAYSEFPAGMLPLSLPAGDRGTFSIESVVTFDPEGKGEGGCISIGFAICILRTECRMTSTEYTWCCMEYSVALFYKLDKEFVSSLKGKSCHNGLYCR